MDTEILFPEIRLFGSSIKGCSSEKQSMDPPVPKISKSRRRKIRLMKMKNSMAGMEVTSTHLRKFVQPVCDGSNLFDLINNSVAAHESSSLKGGGDGRKPVLPVDSLSSIVRDSASPVFDGMPMSAS